MSDTPTCPDCNSEMVLRKNRQTDEEFWGCSDFPACRGTIKVSEKHSAHDSLPSDTYRRADRQRWRN